jgi:protein-S-isoprenylcysteine O-methyltransferase Ste14
MRKATPREAKVIYAAYVLTLIPFLLVGFLIGWHSSHDRWILGAVGLLLGGFAHVLAMWCTAFLLRGRFADKAEGQPDGAGSERADL